MSNMDTLFLVIFIISIIVFAFVYYQEKRHKPS